MMLRKSLELLVFKALGGPVEPLPSAPEHPICEGVFAVRIQHPVVVFPPWSRWVSEDFDKAVIEGQVVSDRVPPAGVLASEERELLHQVVIDLSKGESAGGRVSDGHGYEGDVGIRWFGAPGVSLGFATFS